MNRLFCVLFLIASGLFAADKKTEAETFFREYLADFSRLQKSAYGVSRGGWEEAGKKIAAAAALDPDNLCYRHTNMHHQACIVYKKDLKNTERIAIYRKFLEEAKSLRETWPDYQKSAYKTLFYSPHIPLSPFSAREFLGSMSASERSELIDVFAEIRALSVSEAAAIRDSVGDRFKDRMEMIFFTSAITHALHLVIDNRTAFQLSFDVEMEILKRYVHSSSDFVCQQDIAMTRFPYVVERKGTADFAETLALLQKLLSDPEYQALLKRIKRKEYDLRLLEIQAMQAYGTSDLSPDSLKRVCRDYFKKLEQVTASKANKKFISSYASCLREVSNWILTNVAPKHEFQRIAEQAVLECGDNQTSSLSDEEFLLAFNKQIWRQNRSIPDPLGELRTRAKSMSRLKNHLLLRENPLDIAYTTVTDALYNTDSEAARATIETLFPDFEIRFYRYPKKWGDSVYSCGHPENIYLLSSGDLVRFTTANQQFTNLARLPKYFEYRHFIYDDAGYCIAWNPEYIGVYDIAQDRWSLIEDLSGDEIAGAAIIGKRLFYLNGSATGGSQAQNIALHSCDLQGKKRKLHFSSRRGGGIAEFKGITKGLTSGLVKNSPTSLVFSMLVKEQHLGGVVAFDTERETLTTLQRLPRMAGVPELQKMPDGRLFGSAFYSQYFMLKDNKLEAFLKISPPNPKMAIRDWARHILVMNDKRLIPCLLTQDDLLISPKSRLFVDLKKPDATPFIWLPYAETIVQIAPGQFALPVPIGVYTFKIKK
jgi:hypothetical protein